MAVSTISIMCSMATMVRTAEQRGEKGKGDTHINIHTCTHARTQTHTHTNIHKCTHAHTQTHTNIHTCTHARTQTHTQTYIHAHMHAHRHIILHKHTVKHSAKGDNTDHTSLPVHYTCFSGNHGNTVHVWIVLEELLDDSNDVCEGLPRGVGGVQEVEGFFKEQGHLSLVLWLWIGSEQEWV